MLTFFSVMFIIINKFEDIAVIEMTDFFNIKKLGFGLMRLPRNGDGYDFDELDKMVDAFMAKGFTYFDTAYVYDDGGSEEAFKKSVADRYPRDSFLLADKMPVWCCEKREDLERIFNTSLERTGAGYFDFYLNHSLSKSKLEKIDELGVFEFIQKKKEQGLIKHAGFSFHDSAEVLDEILTKHPEQEFVQLQINYYDWLSDNVQSKKCYDVARKHGKPVIVMEPVRGGSLAVLPDEARKILLEKEPEMSVASWALRFAASPDGVMTVLSGMSDLRQMTDNLSFMDSRNGFTDREFNTVMDVVDILNKIPTVPCTSCGYCLEGCPMNIKINKIFSVYNDYLKYNNKSKTRYEYSDAVNSGEGKAGDCIGCGACAHVCPQHIDIPEKLREFNESVM